MDSIIRDCLNNYQSTNTDIKTKARLTLDEHWDLNLQNLMIGLSDVLLNEKESPETRSAAGELLIHYLDNEDDSRKQELAQKWLLLAPADRYHVKDNLIKTLDSTDLGAKDHARQVIVNIASIEISSSQCSDLFNMLESTSSHLETFSSICNMILSLNIPDDFGSCIPDILKLTSYAMKRDVTIAFDAIKLWKFICTKVQNCTSRETSVLSHSTEESLPSLVLYLLETFPRLDLNEDENFQLKDNIAGALSIIVRVLHGSDVGFTVIEPSLFKKLVEFWLGNLNLVYVSEDFGFLVSRYVDYHTTVQVFTDSIHIIAAADESSRTVIFNSFVEALRLSSSYFTKVENIECITKLVKAVMLELNRTANLFSDETKFQIVAIIDQLLRDMGSTLSNMALDSHNMSSNYKRGVAAIIEMSYKFCFKIDYSDEEKKNNNLKVRCTLLKVFPGIVQEFNRYDQSGWELLEIFRPVIESFVKDKPREIKVSMAAIGALRDLVSTLGQTWDGLLEHFPNCRELVDVKDVMKLKCDDLRKLSIEIEAAERQVTTIQKNASSIYKGNFVAQFGLLATVIVGNMLKALAGHSEWFAEYLYYIVVVLFILTVLSEGATSFISLGSLKARADWITMEKAYFSHWAAVFITEAEEALQILSCSPAGEDTYTRDSLEWMTGLVKGMIQDHPDGWFSMCPVKRGIIASVFYIIVWIAGLFLASRSP